MNGKSSKKNKEMSEREIHAKTAYLMAMYDPLLAFKIYQSKINRNKE